MLGSGQGGRWLMGQGGSQEAGRVEVGARFSLGSPAQEIWVGWLISESAGEDRGCAGHSSTAVSPSPRFARGGSG